MIEVTQDKPSLNRGLTLVPAMALIIYFAASESPQEYTGRIF